jgi:hypothetical protein
VTGKGYMGSRANICVTGRFSDVQGPLPVNTHIGTGLSHILGQATALKQLFKALLCIS